MYFIQGTIREGELFHESRGTGPTSGSLLLWIPGGDVKWV